MTRAVGIPHLEVRADLKTDDLDAHPTIKSITRRLIPSWSDLPDEVIEATTLTGGISNALFKVTPPEPLRPVVFRVYGSGSDMFTNRASEMTVMQLVHKHGFGTALLGTFEDGRIEAFLDGYRALEPAELADPATASQIARTLARFHAISPASGQVEQGDAEGAAGEEQGDHGSSSRWAGAPRTPFARTYEWLDMASELEFSAPEKAADFAAFDLGALRATVREIEGVASRFGSPPAFSHNDLLSGNIMVRWAEGRARGESPGEMTFIDYEYADVAPRGFDLGNHFCEYAGFNSEYFRYPDEEAARAFLAAYLEEDRAAKGDKGEAGGVKGTNGIESKKREGGDPEGDAKTRERELSRLVAEANVFALAAHAYWGAWCFLQAAASKLDFDYLEYARVRWGELERRKAEFLQGAAKVLESDA